VPWEIHVVVGYELYFQGGWFGAEM
jgi:hypothetical protein